MSPSLMLSGIGADGGAQLVARELSPDYPYTLETGGDLGVWTNALAIQPTGTNSSVTVTNSGTPAFFRLNAAATSSYVVITREVWPQDSAKAARVGYRIAGGDWQTREMGYAGLIGNNDLWQHTIGPVAPGSTVEYYLEVISASGGGFSHYDNNGNSNYFITVP
jgi:hypothetical protein